MKVFLVLLIANICIATSLADGDRYVYGPNTPIYYPENISTGIKVNMIRSNFGAKKARNSEDATAIFPKLLIVGVSDIFRTQSADRFLHKARNIIDGINNRFVTISVNRPVEMILGGIVMIKDSDVYVPTSYKDVHDITPLHNNLLTQMYLTEAIAKGNRETKYRNARQELEQFTTWFKDNEDQFEDLDAHIILYISPYHLSDDTFDKMDANLVMGITQPSKVVCSSRPIVLVSDLVGDFSAIYAMAVSYGLGVSHMEDRVDSPYFTSSLRRLDSKIKEWKEKAESDIDRNILNGRYSCMKSSDYDY